MPASSTVSMKYGDNGDNYVQFPTITLCKNVGASNAVLWRNAKDCQKSKVDLHPPFLLNYLVDCLDGN